MKKKMLLALGLAPAAVFAEGETSSVSSAVTQIQAAATSAIDAVTPAVITVVVALFTIVGVMFAYRKLKSAIGR